MVSTSERIERSRRAVLVCYRAGIQNGPGAGEFTYWDDADQARQAEAELTPCGPRCTGVHAIARLDLPPDPRRRPGYEPERRRIRT